MIPEKTGLFGTVIPGNAMLTGSHLAAKEPAKKEFRVCDPAKAKLMFDPASVRVPVNEKAPLAAVPGGNGSRRDKEKQRAELLGQGVGYYVAQPMPCGSIRRSSPD